MDNQTHSLFDKAISLSVLNMTELLPTTEYRKCNIIVVDNLKKTYQFTTLSDYKGIKFSDLLDYSSQPRYTIIQQ